MLYIIYQILRIFFLFYLAGASVAHTQKIYELDDLHKFTNLNDGRDLYFNQKGEVFELVLNPDGTIVNSEPKGILFTSVGNILAVVPFVGISKSGFVVFGDKGAIANKSFDLLPITGERVAGKGWKLRDTAVIDADNGLFILTEDGDLARRDMVVAKRTYPVSDKSLVDFIRIIAIDQYLVLLDRKGGIFRWKVANGVMQGDKEQIGNAWGANTQIASFNDNKHFVIKSGKNIVSYQNVNGGVPIEIGKFYQALPILDKNIFSLKNGELIVSSAKTSHQRKRVASIKRNSHNGVLGGTYHLVNIAMHNVYFQSLPKCPVILDDLAKTREINLNGTGIAVKLDPAYFLNIPQKIRSVLKDQNIDKNNVDIFFHIQKNENIGEDIDNKNGEQSSQIKLHCWADPETPINFKGTRLKRPFIITLFEPDLPAIQGRVGPTTKWINIDILKEFSVNVHDNKISPRTAWIKIGSRSISQSFFSLGIDHLNPDTKRAAVTLHMILTQADYDSINQNNWQDISSLINELRGKFVANFVIEKLLKLVNL